MASVRHSLLTSLAGTNAQTAIGLIGSIILARVLTPADIGVFAVGAGLIALCHTIRDMGIGGYLIQEKELTDDRIRSAQGVALLVSWPLGALLLLGSGPIADIYDEPSISSVVAILALNFFVLPFGATTQALLVRDMRFAIVYAAETAAAFTNLGVSVGLALAGYGVYSLAWGGVAATLVGVAITVAAARGARTHLVPSLAEFRRVFAVGSRSSLASLLGTVASKLPELVSGKLLGFHATGIFSKAMGATQIVFLLIVRGVGNVVTANFAETDRRGESLSAAYQSALTYILGIALPAFLVLAVTAEDVILLLYGRQWIAAAPLVSILCIGTLPWLKSQIIVWLLTATGHMQQFLNARAAWLTATLALVPLGALFGLATLAATIGLANFIGLLFYRRALGRLLNMTLATEFDILGRAFLLGLGTVAPVFIVKLVLASSATPIPIVASLAILGVTAAMSWVTTAAILRHPLWTEVRSGVALMRGKLQGAGSKETPGR